MTQKSPQIIYSSAPKNIPQMLKVYNSLHGKHESLLEQQNCRAPVWDAADTRHTEQKKPKTVLPERAEDQAETLAFQKKCEIPSADNLIAIPQSP